jgi:hypothetical protein
MDDIASESVLRQAYTWLCECRLDHSSHDDVRDVRWRWEEIRPQRQAQLRTGVYRLDPVRRFDQVDATIEVWSAVDALVLKATALVLTSHWVADLSQHCHHLLRRGGAKAVVRFVHENLAVSTFVFRTDVRSYYACMDHVTVLGLLDQAVSDWRVLDLLRHMSDGHLWRWASRGRGAEDVAGLPALAADGGTLSQAPG